MKALIQRVIEASVTVDGHIVGKIGRGLAILVGIHANDTKEDAEYLISRILTMKLWPDEATGSQWKKSVVDVDGSILLVSQFSLYAVVGKKGRAPDFHLSMKAALAKEMFDSFVASMRRSYRDDRIQTGMFQAYMSVSIQNDGPVTIDLESEHCLKLRQEGQALRQLP